MAKQFRKSAAALGVLAGLGFLPALVHAQGIELEEGINIVGLGVGQVPDYQGSDDMEAAVGPFLRNYFSGQRYYWMPVHEAVVMHIGAGFAYASEDYMQTYYGVSGANDIALFGSPYTADGGVSDVRATVGAVIHLCRTWHLGVGVRDQGLMGTPKTVRWSTSAAIRISGSTA